MNESQLVPGDLIEWTYKSSDNIVASNEMLYSSTMKKRVPVGGTALLITICDDGQYVWLSENGLFHARVDDTMFVAPPQFAELIVPRSMFPAPNE